MSLEIPPRQLELPPHPMQPFVIDEKGRTRFRENRIVSHICLNMILDRMPEVFRLKLGQEEHEQFVQLIGYSVGGACEISSLSDGFKLRALLAEQEFEKRRQVARSE